METWIHQVLNSGQAGITVLIAVFFLGMIGVLTCSCNFAVFAVVAGYSGTLSAGGKAKNVVWSGVAFLIGAIIAMAVIGGILGYAGGLISKSIGNYWRIAAGLVCVFFGLYSLDILPFKIPAISINTENRKTGIISAIIFGLTVGGLFSALNTCCNPLFPIVLAASFVKGSTIWGMIMLTVFALGYALPLAVAIVGVRLGLGKASTAVSKLGTVVKYVGGILLITMGFYFLITI
jgi:cytochrome c biogenesis protein CcdA